jgi:hypothetical protein
MSEVLPWQIGETVAIVTCTGGRRTIIGWAVIVATPMEIVAPSIHGKDE